MRSGVDVAADTAWARDDQESTFTGLFTIRRSARAADSVDGWTVTWSDVATGVSGALSDMGRFGGERDDADLDRRVSANGFILHLVVGTDVEVSDRVLDESSNLIYEVVSIGNPVSEPAAMNLRVSLVE